MDEAMVRAILGTITDADPVKRTIAVGLLTAAIVQWVIKPVIVDDRYYSPAAILIAVGLSLAAAAVTDGMFGTAALFGLVIGVATAGTVNAVKRVMR